MERARGPAYRIMTDRLMIRCWKPSDAPLLKAAIDESLQHLAPWMPWASAEPQTVEEKVARIRTWRAKFDSDEDYIFGVFDRDETRVLGGTGLHTRAGEGAREIGYWIHAAHIRRGLGTELAGALTRVGFEVDGVGRIEIHCDPNNHASAGVPKKLGYVHEATLRAALARPDGTFRPTMIWTMLKSEAATSPVANVRVEAYDAVDARIL
jgi:RimJ/RimL family protein N-acetyltransferase